MRKIRTSDIETHVWIAIPALVLALLAGSLIGTDRLAYRDVSHFYTPLYDYVAQRCHDEWLPMWNPLDQTGIPLVGETTTAVFYPVRYVLFALPISASVAIAWYVAVHLLIASITAVMAARAIGVSRSASYAAGIVYPLSGSIWFLYTNPPYLVSAAWLPLAMASLTSKNPSSKTLPLAAIAMSMMILGGDPQTALHAMLVAGLVGGWRVIQRRSSRTQLVVLLFAPLLAAMMSLPQIAASISWSRQSTRVRPDLETSRIAPPIDGGKRHDAYQFSLPPWHLLETITPNASGSLLPVYRRVSQLIPGDGRMWTPTIYAGMLSAIALLSRLVRVRRDGIEGPLAITLLSIALAGGHFGLVWWIQAFTGQLADVDSGVGGPYWLLYQYLPGYDSFRYPAKWLTVTAFGVSMLVARWLDGITWRETRRTIAILSVFIAIGSAAIAYAQFRSFAPVNAATLPRDRFWGPLDIAGGLSQIQRSCIHSTIMLVAIASLIKLAEVKAWKPTSLITALLLTTMLDLGIVACGITHTVNIADERSLVEAIVPQRPTDVSRWMRTRTGTGWPTTWSETSNDSRLLEVEASQRAAWFARWHLQDREAVLNSMTSIESQAMSDYWQSNRRPALIDGLVTVTDQPNRQSTFTLVDVQYSRNESKQNQPPDVIRIANDETPLRLELSKASIIVRPSYQDGNWVAEARNKGQGEWVNVRVDSFQGLMQSIQLPQGTWQIRFRYAPWWLPITLITSVLTFVAILWSFVKRPTID